MNGDFDKSLLNAEKCELLVGIDEAGRGPSAGPVVACACIVPQNLWPLLKDVKDSKKLSDAKRRELFILFNKLNIPRALAFVHAKEIDQINILEATFNAMAKAVNRLSPPTTALLAVDGNKTIKHLTGYKQTAVVKGDNKSLSVACASITAKVARDNWMLWLHKQYPYYNFASHKGYWTKQHEFNVRQHGLCPQHRRSFIPMWYQVNK